jgi:hypothetical protein
MRLRRLAGSAVLLMSALASVVSSTTAGAATCSWTLMPDPPFDLWAIAGVSHDEAWLVGSTSTVYVHPAAARFDGSGWVLTRLPDLGYEYGSLHGVDALRTGDIWAVGSHQLASVTSDAPLAEYWNGSTWTSSTPPASPGGPSYLHAVDARTARDVWAVGWHQMTTGSYKGLVEHWNGTRWSHLPSPPSSGVLVGVAAAARDDVWAIAFDTLWHWDGGVWTSTTVGVPGARLTGISAVSASDVWAAGYSSGEGSLTLHWNGSAWSDIAAPDIGSTVSQIQAVAATSATDAYAVGFRGSHRYTVVMHWNGIQWSNRRPPSDGLNSQALLSVSMLPHSRTVWTAGESQLVERFC